MITPTLPDPSHARAGTPDRFHECYIDPLMSVVRELTTLCLVSTWMRVHAQAVLDELLWIDDRGGRLEQAERRCLSHPLGGAQVRRVYVVNVQRETAIGTLVGRCSRLVSLVAEDPFQVALPPTCTTLIMPAFHSPGALQCTLAAVTQLRCLRMPHLNMARLDDHMRALIADCPDVGQDKQRPKRRGRRKAS